MYIKKFWRNLIALIRGSIVRVFSILRKGTHIGRLLRLFKGASLDIYYRSKCKIGKNVRIDNYSSVVVTEYASLVIGENVGIGYFNRIICRGEIVIGSNTILGPNVMIYDHDHLYDASTGVDRKNYKVSSIIIGTNCWIGANSVILKGAKIGNNCLIAAGSIVTGMVPDGTKLIQKKESEAF